MIHDKLHCNGFVDKALQFVEARDFKRIVLVANWYDYFAPRDGAICFMEGASCVDTRDPARYFAYLDASLASLRTRLQEFRNRGAELSSSERLQGVIGMFRLSSQNGNFCDLTRNLSKRSTVMRSRS